MCGVYVFVNERAMILREIYTYSKFNKEEVWIIFSFARWLFNDIALITESNKILKEDLRNFVVIYCFSLNKIIYGDLLFLDICIR